MQQDDVAVPIFHRVREVATLQLTKTSSLEFSTCLEQIQIWPKGRLFL